MKFSAVLLTVILCILTGCASTSKNKLEPAVELVSIQKSATAASMLEFDIKLRITNPNDAPLELSGLYYELSLESIDVVKGTANDLPVIEGYSNETILVQSAADMINGARLVSHLINNPQDIVEYDLRVKLGSKSPWSSGTIIQKEGEIPLK